MIYDIASFICYIIPVDLTPYVTLVHGFMVAEVKLFHVEDNDLHIKNENFPFYLLNKCIKKILLGKTKAIKYLSPTTAF